MPAGSRGRTTISTSPSGWTDADRIAALLRADGWVHAPEPQEDGYTVYERGVLRLELAFLARAEDGEVYTPLRSGQRSTGRRAPFRTTSWSCAASVRGSSPSMRSRPTSRRRTTTRLWPRRTAATSATLSRVERGGEKGPRRRARPGRRVEREEDLDDARVELRAGGLAQAAARLLDREPLAVRPVGRHRVVGVADEDDAGLERDLLAGEAVGVAAAVPVLVAVADDLADLLEPLDRREDARAQLGMEPTIFHSSSDSGPGLARIASGCRSCRCRGRGRRARGASGPWRRSPSSLPTCRAMSVIQRACEDVYSSFASSALASASTVERNVCSRLSKLDAFGARAWPGARRRQAGACCGRRMRRRSGSVATTMQPIRSPSRRAARWRSGPARASAPPCRGNFEAGSWNGSSPPRISRARSSETTSLCRAPASRRRSRSARG